MKNAVLGINLAVDASRNRSGGAIVHLKGLIESAEPQRYGFSQVHVWSYDTLLGSLPDRPWLVRHCPRDLDRGIISQLYWQKFRLSREMAQAACGIVLNTDAGTVGDFHPAVTMSRDMLSYEPGEMERFGFGRARLRLWALRSVQNRSLRTADGAIFLTNYAARIIQGSCGKLGHVAVIPHGVQEELRDIVAENNWPEPHSREIRCLYISNAAPYKHQWNVVRAIERLRQEGYAVSLSLIGGADGMARNRLKAQISASDPDGAFVTLTPVVPHKELPSLFRGFDLFVFASTCENMPNTLLEGMAAGFPIASSNRGPMPEVLRDGGTYFNPEDEREIAAAIRTIIDNGALRQRIAYRAKEFAREYSWRRCAHETLSFLAQTYARWSN